MRNLDTAYAAQATATRKQLDEAFRARRASQYRALGLKANATADQIHTAITSQS